MSERVDHPAVHLPPPLIFAAFFFAGLLMQRWLPVHIPYGRPTGVVLVIVAIAIATWGLLTMHRVRTGIIPHHPATELVARGPFAFSRNPLYVSLTCAYIGAALWFSAIPALILLPITIAVLQLFVIRREEAYLERRFGDAYRAYRANVRRWL
ncbi:MAG TPA: isoprenylcysteine carboxylmethyltransferase family protein [Thermoanaerobaculia bacterium]